ncbi:hypothetical protein ACFLZ7_03890 [Nanoarchaeota archaeon]
MAEVRLRKAEGIERVFRDGFGSGRFICAKPAKTINVYMFFSDDSEQDHEYIRKQNRLQEDSILGGGFVGYQQGTSQGFMRFDGKSRYGTVPDMLLKGPLAEQLYKKHAKDSRRLTYIISKMSEPDQRDVLNWEGAGWPFEENAA